MGILEIIGRDEFHRQTEYRKMLTEFKKHVNAIVLNEKLFDMADNTINGNLVK